MRRLEVDEVRDLHIERSRDTAQHVDAHIGRAGFDPPQIRATGARDQRKLTLRDALPRPRVANMRTEAFLFTLVVHSLSVCLLIWEMALYREHIQRA